MKKTVTLCALLLGLLIVNNALAVTVDGYCYLEGETNHSGTKVLFSAVSPSAVTDSTYTNADGYFIIGLTIGIYSVQYSHEGWQPYTIPGEIEFFEDTTLYDVTLSAGIVEEVRGPQSGIWTSDYLYQVIGDISVNSGDTLIIEPGVTVKFMDYYSFIIYGTLLAAGTENDTILFTSGQPTVNPGDWNRIKFDGSSASNSVISYSKIEYTTFGIYCYYSSPTISNNTISNNNSRGIYCYYYSSPTISNNTISNNSDGIYCDYSSPTISNNTISNNNSRGIYCYYYSSPTISNNTISNNNYGIYCDSSSPSISNNTISNNSLGIYCYYYSSPTISNNTISNNSDGIYCRESFFLTISSNTISNNNYSGIYCYDSSSLSISNNTICNNYYGIECFYASSPTISNNTICNNYYGIYCYCSSPTISNNTICNNYDGIYCDWNSSPNILNNILYDNYSGIYAGSSPSALEYNLFWLNDYAGSGSCIPTYFGQIITVNANGDSCDTYCNLFMDPLFVNPDSLDFHLTENSPCIDAGDPTSPFDPDGTVADMGAFYFDQSIIELSSFTATYVDNYILICWTTAWEIDVMGFNIYRNTEDVFETAIQINAALIPGHGTTSEPHSYTFADYSADINSTYYYWLEVVNYGGLTYVYGSIVYEPPFSVDDYGSPNTFCLYQNYPNPFSSATTISFNLATKSHKNTQINIYNVKGQLVKILECINRVNAKATRSLYSISWDGKDENGRQLGNGIYFYQLRSNNYSEVNKMLLVR